ncbi:PFK5 [Symbiodinium necroappetens]|uniref:PFK5 protein n=1 Tax=Symbiodinium necroappetens TaxID=1628268 RepID=A0A813BF03_9DINO|nr:PFK5 [Symbiodinium necroappetens]
MALGPPKARPPRSGREAADPAKGPEESQEDRREKQDAFFDSLPQDHLTHPELDLRDLLVEALKGKGLAKLSPIASDREFCRRKALLEWPRGIRLTAWIENRIGAEVEVVHGAFGSEVGVRLLDVGGMEEVDPEAFLASLPPDDFTQEENTLRQKLFEAWRDLTSRSDQRDVSLLDLGEHPNVKKAGGFLPPKMLRSWIEARLGAEMLLTENEAGELLADFVSVDTEVAEAPPEAPLVPADARAEVEEKARLFFDGPLRPEEKDLERACIDAIVKSTLSASTSFTSTGCSTPLNLSSVLNADKAFQEVWRRCKSEWAALEPPEGPVEVTLTNWVDWRVADVKVSREPRVSLRSNAVARLGLQRQLQKRPNSPGRDRGDGARGGGAPKRPRPSTGSHLHPYEEPERSHQGPEEAQDDERLQASRPKELANGCVRANACREIFHNPSEVRAAIVTCGGLCPGLNSIIREITNCLWHQYGVKTILGMQAGYNGCSAPDDFPPIQLNVDNVRDIHMKGGSILKAGRGGMDDPEKILDQLEKMGINMLFTVGGDGTQAAANLLYQAARKRDMPLSIVGVPKSIDNDIVFFDKTFGFDSAVAAASEVIRNGWVEATSCAKGVGIVKLMGRDAGFVAMHAALASTIVDLVMIPEVDVEMEEIMKHVDTTLARKDFMVVAVAEGAGQKFVSTGKKDSTGHTVYGDIGTYLKDQINSHLKKSGGRSFYIDPSYIIRSVTIRPNDHIYCSRLARDAVHTAMRGYTGVCVGPIHNIIVVMPSNLIASRKKRISVHSSSWQSCVQSCNMPKSLAGLNK